MIYIIINQNNNYVIKYMYSCELDVFMMNSITLVVKEHLSTQSFRFKSNKNTLLSTLIFLDSFFMHGLNLQSQQGMTKRQVTRNEGENAAKKFENREREKKTNVCVLVFKLLQNLYYKQVNGTLSHLSLVCHLLCMIN